MQARAVALQRVESHRVAGGWRQAGTAVDGGLALVESRAQGRCQGVTASKPSPIGRSAVGVALTQATGRAPRLLLSSSRVVGSSIGFVRAICEKQPVAKNEVRPKTTRVRDTSVSF